MCGCLMTTVVDVTELAQTNRLCSPLPEGLSDKHLAEVLFTASTAKPEHKIPYYEYVAREMQKIGVTLNLMWLEYCEQCSNALEPQARRNYSGRPGRRYSCCHCHGHWRGSARVCVCGNISVQRIFLR